MGDQDGTMIQSAYGPAEAAVFGSDAGLPLMNVVGAPTELVRSWNMNRLQRLNNLVKRVDTLPTEAGFDAAHYKWECPECSKIP